MERDPEFGALFGTGSGASDQVSTSPPDMWIFGAVGARGMTGLFKTASASGSPRGLPSTLARCMDGKSRGNGLPGDESTILISGCWLERSRNASADAAPAGTEWGGGR